MNMKEKYEKENMETIKALSDMKNRLKLKDEVMHMNKRKILNGLDDRKHRGHVRFIPVFAAVLLLVFSMIATTVLAFPGVAAMVAPNIPLVREIAKRDTAINVLSDQVDTYKEADVKKQEEIDDLKTEVNDLKIQVKEISDQLIREIETSKNEDEEQNLRLQTLAVDFVKAMYKGNYQEAAAYCTDEFAQTVLDHPENVIMRPSSPSVVFTQITNVAKVNDTLFLVFLRLNDSGPDMEADYQLDFEIVLAEDAYLISFVGIDA
jgi:hypothetical protein